MGHACINLEDSLHKNLKRRAIDDGIPMRELLIKALEEYMQHNPLLSPRPRPNQTNERAQNKLRRTCSV
jgi:hypothetical protein